jgi:hypothetical protein
MFAGYVDQLKGQPDADGLMSGETILSILSSEEEWFRARILLNANDYAQACDAHKNSQLVMIKGVLRRGTRLHEIVEYDAFRLAS